MADNFGITTGSDKTFRSDDVAGIHYQVVKADVGGDGATIPLVGDSILAAMPVVPRLKRVRVAATPTISSGSIYAAGDTVGAVLTFSSAVRVSGGTGVIRQAVISDKGKQDATLFLVLFSQTVAGTATDNNPFDPDDADLLNILGSVPVSDYADFADNSVGVVGSFDQGVLAIPIVCAATSLFGVLVNQDTPTYTSTSDLTVTLTIDQD
jgi:hypothetical protein